jgi:hypothetical protein
MYISKVHLKNVRAIKDLTLPLEGDSLSPRSLVIGGNSTCKSSLLRAIAIGLCTADQGAALLAELPGRFVGPYGSEAMIKIWLKSSADASDEFEKEILIKPRFEGRKFIEETVAEPKRKGVRPVKSSSLFVCGYGAGRSLDAIEGYERYRLVDAVYTLFKYDQRLQNPELTLYRLNEFYPKIAAVTIDRIRQILRLNKGHRFFLRESGVVVSGPIFGKNIPLDALADGYKGTFTWLCDLVAWAMLAQRINDRTGDIDGIVLIDEIEQHIHPSWQAELIKSIKRVFPSLQIIATTHSPLVALSIGPEGLVVLKRKRGFVYAEADVPDFRGYSVEDMLLDPELFGTDTYSPETSKLLTKYRRLTAVPPKKRNKEQRDALKNLAKTIQERQIEPPLTHGEGVLARELRKLRQKYDL